MAAFSLQLPLTFDLALALLVSLKQLFTDAQYPLQCRQCFKMENPATTLT
jgi:hypothetical protein